MPSGFQIIQITIVRVCFTLERNVLVCHVIIHAADKPNQPFQNIKDIEEHIQQFPYLGCVYTLMVKSFSIAGTFRKKNSE